MHSISIASSVAVIEILGCEIHRLVGGPVTLGFTISGFDLSLLGVSEIYRNEDGGGGDCTLTSTVGVIITAFTIAFIRFICGPA